MAEEDKDLYVPAGHLLMTSSGDYSDYHTGGCFVTLEPLYRSKLNELVEEVKAEHQRAENAYDVWLEDPNRDEAKRPEYTYGSSHGMFISAMIRKGWLLDVTYTELHIGSYSTLELSL